MFPCTFVSPTDYTLSNGYLDAKAVMSITEQPLPTGKHVTCIVILNGNAYCVTESVDSVFKTVSEIRGKESHG